MAKLNVLFFADCVVLGYIGQSPLEAPFLFLGQLSTALYFLYFALCPVINYLDTLFVKSITSSDKNRVLGFGVITILIFFIDIIFEPCSIMIAINILFIGPFKSKIMSKSRLISMTKIVFLIIISFVIYPIAHTDFHIPFMLSSMFFFSNYHITKKQLFLVKNYPIYFTLKRKISSMLNLKPNALNVSVVCRKPIITLAKRFYPKTDKIVDKLSNAAKAGCESAGITSAQHGSSVNTTNNTQNTSKSNIPNKKHTPIKDTTPAETYTKSEENRNFEKMEQDAKIFSAKENVAENSPGKLMINSELFKDTSNEEPNQIQENTTYEKFQRYTGTGACFDNHNNSNVNTNNENNTEIEQPTNPVLSIIHQQASFGAGHAFESHLKAREVAHGFTSDKKTTSMPKQEVTESDQESFSGKVDSSFACDITEDYNIPQEQSHSEVELIEPNNVPLGPDIPTEERLRISQEISREKHGIPYAVINDPYKPTTLKPQEQKAMSNYDPLEEKSFHEICFPKDFPKQSVIPVLEYIEQLSMEQTSMDIITKSHPTSICPSKESDVFEEEDTSNDKVLLATERIIKDKNNITVMEKHINISTLNLQNTSVVTSYGITTSSKNSDSTTGLPTSRDLSAVKYRATMQASAYEPAKPTIMDEYGTQINVVQKITLLSDDYENPIMNYEPGRQYAVMFNQPWEQQTDEIKVNITVTEYINNPYIKPKLLDAIEEQEYKESKQYNTQRSIHDKTTSTTDK